MNLRKPALFVLPLLLAPLAAHAFELPTEPNSAIQTAIDFIITGQYGPAVMNIIDIVGKASVILTAAAFSIESFARAVGGALKMTGMNDFADRIKNASDKIIPYIKFFSLYNVQKGEIVTTAKAIRNNA